jgi:hypothetical protein
VKERVFTFGADDVLMGVLTEPAAGARPGSPAIVLSNVGLNPRVGPNRCWVELARSLASLGFSTLRFDLNGLGDSLPRRDAHNDLERACVDQTEALDFLHKKRGFTRFVLVSMCSGVDSAHRISRDDPRVVGSVFLDGYTYETPRSKLYRYVGRNLSLAGARRAVLRRLPRVGGLEVGEAEEIYTRDYPEPAQFAADLETMLGRQARLLFIYSGGVWLYFNYPQQFFEMLRPARFEGRLEVELRRSADHTYMLPTERKWMVERISSWVAQQFGS